MDYQKIYNDIITKRQNDPFIGYTEKHHILPRSLGGSNSLENLVALSAREHFICHLLLTKIHKNHPGNYAKMLRAFMCMLLRQSPNQERYICSHDYQKLREKFSRLQSETQSGTGNSQYGKNRSDVTKNKIRESIKQRHLEKGHTPKNVKEEKQKEKQKLNELKHQNDVDNYKEYYKLYNRVGWEEFVKITGYPNSKANLVQRFKKLVPEFSPQNGKKRGQK